MKNKLKIYFFCIIILLFSNNFSSADEFTFNASEIIALNNENKIKAINGVEILTKDGVKITGDFVIESDILSRNKHPFGVEDEYKSIIF